MARDDPGCLPPSRTLRRIRWPVTAPVPRPPHRLSSDATTSGRRSLAILGLGRSSPFHSGVCRRTVVPFRPTRPPTFSRRSPRRTRSPFTRTATLLGALHAWVFGTRHRLTTSATAFRRTGNQTRTLSSPCRDEDRDPLPFLPHHALPIAEAVTRGKPRFRPFDPAPVPVPPGCPGLPDRDTKPIAPPRSAFDRGEFSGD
jgi:hypothetical protein